MYMPSQALRISRHRHYPVLFIISFLKLASNLMHLHFLQLAIGGGGGNIGKSINVGVGDGGDDDGDDDDYFDEFDDGDEGDDGGLFRRRIILPEVVKLILNRKY